MRALVLAGFLVVTSHADARADCFGASFGPRGATVRGRIIALEWGAARVVTCPGGSTRCLEAVLAQASEPTHVRVVLDNVVHRDARGARYKLTRLVLDGILPRRLAECQPIPIAMGQTRELDVEARTSAPWWAKSLR